MSAANVISLIVFLWLAVIYGILCFIRAAHPYREESEKQKKEDEEQERWLSQWRNRRKK